ncbi:beta-lactamase-like protein [Delphinella strobiligena]|nr:beta-lactamase-like protein [Delphinella strobiligena]
MTTNGAPTADAEKEPSVSSLIFLGTGTSSQIPAIGCLTSSTSRCRVCPSALHPATQKNRRRNTSAFLTLSNNKTILIDCGKSFFDAALQIWPRARLRQINALLLTHAHADAINGLDDLRGWTLGGFIQPSIDVYLSAATHAAVATTFPYCVDASKATGGGDIPAFRWHIIDEDSDFFVRPCGVTVTTLPTEHGMTFGATPSPFICLGFRIGGVAYISDASTIPARTREKLQQPSSHTTTHGCDIMVLDALKRGFHPSHMSIPETLDFVNALERPARKTYLTDFTHETDHYAFEKELSAGQKLDVAPAYDGLQVFFEDGNMREVDLLGEREWVTVSEVEGWGRLPGRRREVGSMV